MVTSDKTAFLSPGVPHTGRALPIRPGRTGTPQHAEMCFCPQAQTYGRSPSQWTPSRAGDQGLWDNKV